MYKKDLTLVFEGADGSGKSTIIKMMRERYPSLDLVDRAFISDAVYAKKFKRKIYLNVPIKTYLDYWSSWYKYKGDTRIILCAASPMSLTDRCIKKNDDLCKNKTEMQIDEELKKDQESFKAFVLCYSFMFKTLTLQTDEILLEDCIKKIEDFIKDAKV